MMASTRDRPALCVCPKSCMPIYNGCFADDRIKDASGDLSQGYSGECVGKMAVPNEFIYGGNHHKNDLNHCFITPLKGIIRFEECWEDIGNAWHMFSVVLDLLRPLVCCECGVNRRQDATFHQLIPPENWKPGMSCEEYNAAPRKHYCGECGVRMGLLKPHPKNFGDTGLAKYMQG